MQTVETAARAFGCTDPVGYALIMPAGDGVSSAFSFFCFSRRKINGKKKTRNRLAEWADNERTSSYNRYCEVTLV